MHQNLFLSRNPYLQILNIIFAWQVMRQHDFDWHNTPISKFMTTLDRKVSVACFKAKTCDKVNRVQWSSFLVLSSVQLWWIQNSKCRDKQHLLDKCIRIHKGSLFLQASQHSTQRLMTRSRKVELWKNKVVNTWWEPYLLIEWHNN